MIPCPKIPAEQAPSEHHSTGEAIGDAAAASSKLLGAVHLGIDAKLGLSSTLCRDLDAFVSLICMYVCMYVCMYISIYLCMYVCMYIYIYICSI